MSILIFGVSAPIPPACRTGKRFVYIAVGAQTEATAQLHGCHLPSRGPQYAVADHKCDRLMHPKRDLDAMAGGGACWMRRLDPPCGARLLVWGRC
jgi:hypothetical protein